MFKVKYKVFNVYPLNLDENATVYFYRDIPTWNGLRKQRDHIHAT